MSDSLKEKKWMWPVTVTFAFYFDHEATARELGQVAAWTVEAQDKAFKRSATVEEVVVGRVAATEPVLREVDDE